MSYPIRVRACALVIQDEAVLLVEFQDEYGLHYNLPAGGVEPGESVKEAVQREAREEASVEVEVGPLAFVYEYAPHLNDHKYGKAPHGLSLMFDCTLKEGAVPKLSDKPDENQTGAKWIPIRELDNIVLYPNIKEHIKAYAQDRKRNIALIEEHQLEEQA
jgi:8-oxo-dGTP diphosphatase